MLARCSLFSFPFPCEPYPIMTTPPPGPGPGAEAQALAARVLIALLREPWGSILGIRSTELDNERVVSVAKDHGVKLAPSAVIEMTGVDEARRLGFTYTSSESESGATDGLQPSTPD